MVSWGDSRQEPVNKLSREEDLKVESAFRMFSKKSRYSFKKGLPRKVISFPSFSLRFEKSDIGFKNAVVVSKKVDGSAVIRNSIKRKFLDLLKQNSAQDLSYSLVFYLRRNALESQNLNQEIKEAINKLKNVSDL